MNTKPERYGKVIGVKAERLEEYKRLHANVWPEVYAMIHECNIRNFSIFLRKLPDGKDYLFMYFEYVGDNYEADMAKMAVDPTTQKWWQLTDPCQEGLSNRHPGEWWAEMEMVCHND
jgi:L-rhamnose mutarotase